MLSFLRRMFGNGRKEQTPAGTSASPAGRDLLEKLQNQFKNSDDVKFRQLRLGQPGIPVTIIGIEGMTDDARIEEVTIRPLLKWGQDASSKELHNWDVQYLAERVLNSTEVNVVDDFEIAVAAILGGDILLVRNGDQIGLQIDNRGWESRGVQDPVHEVTIRGPRDAFTENLFWNTGLVRRRIRDPNLRIKLRKIGRRSRTNVALLYIEGITSPELVNEIEKRLSAIDIDVILDTGTIEKLIEDQWFSPFPQHLKTERPDKAASALLEGRAVLMADTTPFVLIMPASLDSFFQTPEDSYDRFVPVSLLRLIRFSASILSTLIPPLYIAFVAYHPDALPTELALRVAASREGVAFPVLVEAILMQLFLEMIKEAGLRQPGTLGQTFGIVGGLILGDVGIRAGIVSEAMVITVAATAIASFTSADREMGTILRLLGLPVMFSAALLGLYGVVMGGLLIGIHLAILRSYGVPYLVPYIYYKWSDVKDTTVRLPLLMSKERPAFLGSKMRRRQGDRTER